MAAVFELSSAARRLARSGDRIPGVSAMQVAAARLGAPLGHDFCAISLSDLLTPWPVIEQRLGAAAAGDFVVALYNQYRSGAFQRSPPATSCSRRARPTRPSPLPAISAATARRCASPRLRRSIRPRSTCSRSC
jgi:precorrin-3B methylase